MHKNCFGADVIGMTALTEAKLAGEAEIAYGVVGLVTDYDAWHPGHDNVDAFSVIEVVKANAAQAQALVKEVLRAIIAAPFTSASHTALDIAVMTRDSEDKKAAVSQKVRQELEPLFGRFVPPLPKEAVKTGKDKGKDNSTKGANKVDYSGLEQGMRLQAQQDGSWYAAEVVTVSKGKARAKAPVKVHYLGYGADDDEWLGADRLRSKAITKS